MTFRQFVINNVLRNKRLYAAYFLSSMFTVMVFFTFLMFAFHPAFLEGDGDALMASAKVNKNALFGMGVAGGIIYIFSFFFVLYSMGSFLQSRKKEFGLLMMQGMSIRQIRYMVFLENMFIGVAATIGGILTGTLFARLILLIAENALIIEESLHFYFPFWAIIVTLVSFIILFLIISIAVTFILRTKKLTQLIKAGEAPKSEPKASIVLTLFALLLLAGGYVTALMAKGPTVVLVMIPVIAMVTLGTYFLFTQISVFVIHFLKKRKKLFWKKTNMLLFADLAFRMKDNARTFFMVAIISTVAFSAIGTLFGLQSYLTGNIEEANPYSFTYVEQDADEAESDIDKVNQEMDDRDIEGNSITAELRYYDTGDSEDKLIVSESMYNDFAGLLDKDTVHVGNDDIIGVEKSDAVAGGYMEEGLSKKPIELENGEAPTLTETIDPGTIVPEIGNYYVVSDDTYDELPEPHLTEKNTVWQAAGGQDDKVIQAGETLTDKVESYTFQANDYIFYSVKKMYGPILFIGLFIGIVFFVSAGSFLYFRLFTDLDDDKAKFAAISKIGLTEKELSRVISRQTALLFFAPIVVALIHGAVALTALSHLFDYSLVTESSIVLGSFFAIQVIYFIIVRSIYIKQVKKAL